MPSMQAARPPVVMFDFQEYGFDTEASEKAGRPIPRVIPFAFIQPDKFTRLEYPAEEWLLRKRDEAIAGKTPPEWVERWQMQFKAWKEGEELPVEGQPVKTWAALNKEQIKRLVALGFVTIELLADVPDSELSVIGLDGRYLRDLARKTLEGSDNRKVLLELAESQQKVRDQEETIKALMERVSALESPDKRGPGRPKGT